MECLPVGLGERSYQIHIEAGLLERLGTELTTHVPASSYGIVADETVAGLYGERLQASIEAAGAACRLLSFPPGEENKNLATVEQLASGAARAELDRGSLLVALGGGVSGDVAGFLAAVYLRGVPFVQVPTSLLAQVDSSVGGKTGVDIPEGKNLVGAFHQPRAVYIDPEVLGTLPRREFVNGMAEVIKHGVIRDAAYFRMLDDRFESIMALDPGALQELIAASCRIKAEVVGADETETGLRRVLNYGHTIGHAIEAASNFAVAHGFAVSIGMVAAARIAARKSLLEPANVAAIIALIRRYGLDTEVPADLDRDVVKSYLVADKKRIGGRISFILPTDIGSVTITEEVDENDIDAVLDHSD